MARPPAICLILPLTGPHEALGRRVQRVIQDGFEGAPATLRSFDSHDTGPATRVGQARDAGCDLAIGGLGDRESRTLSEAAEAVGMPLLALGRNPDDRLREHVIHVRTPRAETVAAVARHAVEAEGRTAAHILVPDTAFGREVAGAFRTAFETGGGRIRTERAVPAGEDIAKTAATFAAARATAAHGEGGASRDAAPPAGCERETLFLGYDLATTMRLVSFLEFEGAPVRRGEGGCPPLLILGTVLWNDRTRVSRLGDDLDGARFADVMLPEKALDVLQAEVRDAVALARELLKRLSKKDGGDREALGSEEPGPIARWADGLKFRGATGDLEVHGGRVTGRTIGVFEIRQGEVRAWSPPSHLEP